jgi:hypothetical protein
MTVKTKVICCGKLPKSYELISLPLKDPLKARIVHILFSQIGKMYAKYTVESFTIDKLITAYQIENMV